MPKIVSQAHNQVAITTTIKSNKCMYFLNSSYTTMRLNEWTDGRSVGQLSGNLSVHATQGDHYFRYLKKKQIKAFKNQLFNLKVINAYQMRATTPSVSHTHTRQKVLGERVQSVCMLDNRYHGIQSIPQFHVPLYVSSDVRLR